MSDVNAARRVTNAVEAIQPDRSAERGMPPAIQVYPQFEEHYCSAAYLDDVLQHRFEFNGERYDLGDSIAWLQNPSRDIEWQILLHKFYYAPGLARRYVQTGKARYLDGLCRLIDSWIEATPIDFIAADVTARRIQNWIYAWQLIESAEHAAFDDAFRARVTRSLAEQTASVLENLAPRRNHRTLELYAVFLTALAFPTVSESARWRDIAVAGMLDNIAADLLPDGVHCEQSTDYHHIVLRSYLLFVRLCAAARIELPQAVAERLQRALDFAMYVHRPDGMIPALSDSDSRDHRELLSWAARIYARDDYAWVATAGRSGTAPVTACVAFEHGGYAVQRSDWQRREPFAHARYLILDAGPIGEGNHGHLDGLSIEVYAYGKPLIVDPGRYTYDENGETNWRAHFRQTRAHNTVCVNGTDQAIYTQAAKRRKIREPRPDIRLVRSTLTGRLPYLHGRVVSPCYQAVHERHVWFVDESYWIVLDRLSADSLHHYALHYQLTTDARDCVSVVSDRGSWLFEAPGLSLSVACDGGAASIETGYVSKDYGVKLEAPRIRVAARAANCDLLSIIVPEPNNRRSVSIVRHGDGHRLHIDRAGRGQSVTWNRGSGALVLDDGRRTTLLAERDRHASV